MSKTKALSELLADSSGKSDPLNFIIPHYQRGYRWEEQEVTELLDDLWTFCKDKESGLFYCLQPIVIRKIDKNSYEVLDGQQRLTTIYLILSFLEAKCAEDGYNQKLFKLNYETRADCEAFLADRKFISSMDDANIDYYYIRNAYQTISNWFEKEKHRGAKSKLVPILMDDSSKGNRNVRFIWYEVASEINPIDVFIRLNIGKIPLTDAELSKALLLHSDKYGEEEVKFIKKRLYEIASEWDRIEYTLQKPEVWYFLSNNDVSKPTHIEFIFDLVADDLLKTFKYFDKKPIKHSTFLILNEHLQDLIDNKNFTRIEAVEEIWKRVSRFFEYFCDWVENSELYHYIGFLIAIKPQQPINYLIIKAETLPKKAFITFLESEIGKIILIHNKDSLKELSYEDDAQAIHKILLLHNIYASLKSDKEKARFPFNLYKQTKKNEKWSLEHIHAQNSQQITKDKKKWLEDHIRSLENQKHNDFADLITQIEELNSREEVDQKDFDEIFNYVYDKIQVFSINSNELHSISNLCLVDAHINSALNNSVFDVKREKIKELEVQGKYIPVCTRNVFMKSYTNFPASYAYWTDQDRDAYMDNITETYNHFVKSIIKD